MTEEKNNLIPMRRKDRAISTTKQLERMLEQAPYVTVSTSVDNQPYTHIFTFVYDSDTHAMYAHTAKKGTTRDNILKNQKVSFAVADMGRLLPAKTAKEMSVEYASVVGIGEGEIMTDMTEAREKMQLMVDKYFPHLKSGEDYEYLTEKACEEISVLKIRITHWSGKGKQVEEKFPGAFSYGQPPR